MVLETYVIQGKAPELEAEEEAAAWEDELKPLLWETQMAAAFREKKEILQFPKCVVPSKEVGLAAESWWGFYLIKDFGCTPPPSAEIPQALLLWLGEGPTMGPHTRFKKPGAALIVTRPNENSWETHSQTWADIPSRSFRFESIQKNNKRGQKTYSHGTHSQDRNSLILYSSSVQGPFLWFPDRKVSQSILKRDASTLPKRAGSMDGHFPTSTARL